MDASKRMTTPGDLMVKDQKKSLAEIGDLPSINLLERFTSRPKIIGSHKEKPELYNQPSIRFEISQKNFHIKNITAGILKMFKQQNSYKLWKSDKIAEADPGKLQNQKQYFSALHQW
jgi:hypothetical protein